MWCLLLLPFSFWPLSFLHLLFFPSPTPSLLFLSFSSSLMSPLLPTFSSLSYPSPPSSLLISLLSLSRLLSLPFHSARSSFSVSYSSFSLAFLSFPSFSFLSFSFPFFPSPSPLSLPSSVPAPHLASSPPIFLSPWSRVSLSCRQANLICRDPSMLVILKFLPFMLSFCPSI